MMEIFKNGQDVTCHGVLKMKDPLTRFPSKKNGDCRLRNKKSPIAVSNFTHRLMFWEAPKGCSESSLFGHPGRRSPATLEN